MVTGVVDRIDDAMRDRLLVVGRCVTDPALMDNLRERLRGWSVSTCDSYLRGVAEAGAKDFHAILTGVDPTFAQMRNALGGLREAAGPSARLILCCAPEAESLARQMLNCGADDYVLYPFDVEELNGALGLTGADTLAGTDRPDVPAASMTELHKLAHALEGLGDSPKVLLDRIADLILHAVEARGSMVVIHGAMAAAGESFTKPVLSAPVHGPAGVIGQLCVNERREGSYQPGDAEKLKHYAGVVRHLVEAASQQRRWRQLALTDACSGLPNRRYLLDRLDEILEKASARRLPVTVLLFDVDDFKSFNDEFGHDAGDEIIRTMGELFRRYCREQDVVARYGGDEFAVVFWDPQGPRVAGSEHPDGPLQVLDRVKQALKTQRLASLGERGGTLTISGGLATYPWDGTTREALIRKADEALLSAKRAGKNRIYLIGEAETPP